MTWHTHYANGQGRRHWPNCELVAFVAGKRFTRVLEAGSGVGGNLRLWDVSTYVVGLDGYLPILREARANVARGAMVGGDVRALPFREASFDLVIDCLTSQHVPWLDHAPLYREYRRVLQTGGWLWIQHLDDETEGERRLFPTVTDFCLPKDVALFKVVKRAGFARPTVRGLMRIYPYGQAVASYSIIEAEAA